MKRVDEIEKEAHRVSRNGDEFSSFIQGAEWGDKTMIDKACEWLNKTLYIHTEINGIHCGVYTIDWVTSDYNSVSDFIDGFRKALKE